MHTSSTPAAISNTFLPQYPCPGNLSQLSHTSGNPIAQPGINLMPPVSFSSIPVCTTSTSVSSLLVSTVVQQPQQSVIFSAAPGNFFIAQSAPVGSQVVGTPSFVLAPGQGNPNAFVVAQPMPQVPNTTPTITTNTAPPNCIIRLPDGRLVLPATSPNNLGVPHANLNRLSVPQSTFFPVSISCSPAINSPISVPPSLAPHLTPAPGQAFYIHMPPNSAGLSNSVLTNAQAVSGTCFQNHVNSAIKPGTPLPFVNSPLTALPHQTPTLMATPAITSRPSSQLCPRAASMNIGTIGSGLINRPTGMIIPPACSSAPQLMDAQSFQNQQKICNMSMNTPTFANLQPLPSGMAFARLPNGTFTTVPLNSSGILTPFPVAVNNAPVSSTVPPTPVSIASNVRKNAPRLRSKTPNCPVDTAVLTRRLDDQIDQLQNTAAPTESQLHRLKQLTEIKHQLVKASILSTTTTTSLQTTRSNVPVTNITSIAPVTPAVRRPPNPTPVQISPSLRRELLDLLSRHNLLPRSNFHPNEETFVVEFRLNQQRYQLRLTGPQKVDMERLLFSITSKRQAEILTLFQQEQARLANSSLRPRLPIPPMSCTTPAIVTSTPSTSVYGFSMPQQPVRLQPNVQTFPTASSLPMHAFPGTPGLRLVATRPVLPAGGLPGTIVRPGAPPICSSASVMGVVAALTIPPVGAQCVSTTMFASNLTPNSGTINVQSVSSSLSGTNVIIPNTCPTTSMFAMPLSSFSSTMNGPQNFVITPSNFPNSINAQTVLATNSKQQQSIAHSNSCSIQPNPVNLITPVRPLKLNAHQAAKISRFRSMLAEDWKVAIEKPTVLPTKGTGLECLPTSLELLESLAPFHVFYDADNTREALLKVDQILEKSMNYLLKKKQETIEAVNSIIFKESLHKLEPPLEDRLILAHMALDLERDVLKAEKDSFAEVTGELPSNNTTSKDSTTINTESISKPVNVDDGGPDENENEKDSYLNRFKANESKRRCSNQMTSFLRYPTSLLPSPWCSLLGPLANLRPLIFDENGKTKFAEIELPSTVDRSDLVSSNTVNRFGHHNQSEYHSELNIISDLFCKLPERRNFNPNSDRDDDDDLNDESSDEAEADRLLGLGNLLTRSKLSDKHSSRNGILEDNDRNNNNNNNTNGNINLNLNNNNSLNDNNNSNNENLKEHSGTIEFDEAYDFWQELMNEGGMSIDETDHTGMLENSLDSESMSLLQGEPPSKSSRLLDNGQSYMAPAIQHSEDPDIDAAIRSILSASD